MPEASFRGFRGELPALDDLHTRVHAAQMQSSDTAVTTLYARYTYIDTIGVVLNLCELSDDPGEGLLQSDRVGQDLMTKG